MNRLNFFTIFSITLLTPVVCNAQVLRPEFVDILFDFAEETYPDLFPPSVETEEVDLQGVTWLVRQYGQTLNLLAVNTADGHVYGRGPDFG